MHIFEKLALPFPEDLRSFFCSGGVPGLVQGTASQISGRDFPHAATLLYLAILTEENPGTRRCIPKSKKQKLDCALHLTESIAADFNNVLTSILGHTSLVLKKSAERSRLLFPVSEIKAAAKAAEITTDLASFTRQSGEPQSKAFQQSE